MADLRLRVLLSTIDKATKPLRDIMAGSSGTAKALRETRDRLKELERTQKDLSAFRQLRTDSKNTSGELEAAQQRVNKLAAEIRAAEAPTKQMTRDFERARKEAARLKDRHGEQTRKLHELRSQLGTTGISTRKMQEEQRRLREETDKANRAMQMQKARLEQLAKVQASSRRMHQAGMKATLHGAGATFLGAQSLRGGAAAMMPSITFESAMADVRKVVDFDTPEQFAQMARDIQDLSTQLPIAQEGLAAIVAAAGQSNIARQDLIAFARDAARMGVAFDITADEAGETMAKFRTAFRLNQEEVMTLADRINHLGNTTAAGTGPITDIVRRIGALGDVAGLDSGSIAALGATIASMGVESEIGATGIKNLMLSLTAGAAATKAQRGALQALRLDAEELAAGMQTDAAGAILTVLQRLRELPAAQRSGTLTKLFGRESVAAIAPLLTNLETLRENFDKVGDQAQFSGSMLKEFIARADTTEAVLQLTGNATRVAASELGSALLPTLKSLAIAFTGFLRSLTGFLRRHPKLSKALGLIAAAFAVLLTIGGALVFSFGSILMATAGLRIAMATAAPVISAFGGALLWLKATAIPAVLTGLRALFGFLLTNPIGWIILAIGAAAYLIYRYWEPISAFFKNLWARITAEFAGGGAAVRNLLAGMFDGIRNWFGGIGNLVAGLFTGDSGRIRAGLAQMWDGINGILAGWPARFLEFGRAMVSGLIAGFNLDTVKAAIGAAADSTIGWFKEKLGINSPSRVFMEFGGDTMEGYRRGLSEQQREPLRLLSGFGRELRTLGAGLAIGTAAAPAIAIDHRPPVSTAAPAQVSGGIHIGAIHIHATPGMDTQDLARMVREEIAALERERSARKRASLSDYG